MAGRGGGRRLVPERRGARGVVGVVGAERLMGSLVERVAGEIREIYVRKGLEAAVAVGEHVLKTFYGGRLGAWREVGTRHVSVTALAKRADLGMSASTLWSCLRVLEQLEELPDELGTQLSLSHHQSLFSLPDKRTRSAFARRAVSGRWGSKVLRAKVSALALLWGTIALSAYLVAIFWVQLVLLAVAVGVSAHLLMIKTSR